MVKKLLPFFFILFILASCGGRYRALMDMAEAQMTSAPDSSLALLERIGEKDLHTRGLQARYFLLRTMARDKCYMDMAGDTCIRVSYEWYQHHGGKRYHMLASYYAGVVQQAAGNSLEATLAFREAEPLAEALSDYRQLSLIEQHLSAVFAGNYDHVRALEYAEKSLKAAEASGDSLMADYCRLDYATQLLSQLRFGEAGPLFQQILSSNAPDTPIYSLAAKALGEVYFFKRESDYILAKQRYLEVEKAGIIPLNGHEYGILAVISESEGDSRKANYYMSLSENFLESALDSVIYYNDYRNLYDVREDWKNAHYAKTESAKIQNRVVTELLGSSLSHSMENYYQKEKEMVQIQSRSQRYLFSLIGIIILVLGIAAFYIVWKRNRIIVEEMATIQDMSSEMVNTLITDKIKELQRLSESYFSWEDMSVRNREKKQGMQTRDEIISAFRGQLSELRNDHSFISALESSLNLNQDGLMNDARRLLPNEKELDFSILTLLFSGFSIKSISFLLRMSEASLRMRKTRYKQQFEKMPPSNRERFIIKLS